ncbi:MAG: hypothetical protein H6Q14_2712 [Bacteroidetes bacterium]|nr:hypothetical protein [Bacteroidota bacterium]
MLTNSILAVKKKESEVVTKEKRSKSSFWPVFKIQIVNLIKLKFYQINNNINRKWAFKARLKKYKESNIEFTKILKKNPTNDRYIDWYKSNKKNEIDRIFWAFIILGLGYYFVVLILQFSGHRIENLILREIGLATALLAIVGSFVWKKLIDKQTIKSK